MLENNSDLSIENLNTILEYTGKIEGLVGSCNFNDLANTIQNQLNESTLKAKGILIHFNIHKDQTLFLVNGFIIDIYDLINDKADVVFSVSHHNFEDKEWIEYKIILTGL